MAAILFGYAFAPRGGALQPRASISRAIRCRPPDAPIVSQNYTDWAPTQPDPAQTWDQVSGLDPQYAARLPIVRSAGKHPDARRDPGAGADLGAYRPLAAAAAR